jgi:CHAT domain-containing protein
MYACSRWLIVACALLAGDAAWAQEQVYGSLWLHTRDVTVEEAGRLGWPAPRGTKVVRRPQKGSPAEAAGVEAGDVIVAVDGVELKDTRAFMELQKGTAPGTALSLRTMRAGKEMTIAAKLAAEPEEIALLFQRAWPLLLGGQAEEGMALAQQALERAEKKVGPEDELVSQVLLGMAVFHGMLGSSGEAERTYKRVIAIKEKVLGPDHPEVASTIDALASFYLVSGRHADAEALYQRSLALQEKAPDYAPAALSRTLVALAGLYRQQDLPAKVEPLYRRALAAVETAYGPDHPDLEPALGALGSFYDSQKRYDESERVYQRSLAIMEKARGSEHPDLQQPLDRLASFYRARRRAAEAEPLYKRALAIVEKAYGTDHLAFANQVTSLAELYRSQHRYSDVEEIYLRALASIEKAHGADSPKLRDLLELLAGVYQTDLRRPEKAEPLYRRSLAIVETARGPDDPDVLRPLNHLAWLYEVQFRHKDAVPVLERLVAILEKEHGPDHRGLVETTGLGLGTIFRPLPRLAKSYESQRRYDEAEKLYERSLAIMEKARGPDHPAVREPLEALRQFYERRNQYTSAEPGSAEKWLTQSYERPRDPRNAEKMEQLRKRSLAFAERALELGEKKLGPDHPGLGAELNSVAGLYLGEKRYADAEPLYRRWLAIIEKTRGADHLDVRLPLDALAALHERQDKHAEALPFRERALTIVKKARAAAHGDVKKAVDALASLYEKVGQPDKTEALRKSWLAEVESVLPADHEDLLGPINGLASFYQRQYRYAEAEPLRKRALALADTAHGPDSSQAKDALRDLADLYMRLRRYAEAEPLYKRKLAHAEKESGGSDGPFVRFALLDLAKVYREQKRYAEAVPLARRAYAVAENDDALIQASFGTDSQRTDFSTLLWQANLVEEAETVARAAVASAKNDYDKSMGLLDLADLSYRSMRWVDAETYYRRGLELAEAYEKAQKFTTTHVRGPVIRARHGLALLLHTTGRLAEADALFQKMRPGTQSVEAVDAAFAHIYFNYAELLEAMGRLDEALELSRRVLSIEEKLRGQDHPEVAVTLNSLAGMLWRAGRLEEAEPTARRALTITEKAYGPGDPSVANVLNTLALLVESGERVAEAEPLFRRVIAIDEKAFGPDHRALASPLRNLGLLVYRSGRTDEAEQMMRRALFIGKNTWGPGHPSVALFLSQLAIMRAGSGDWVQAAALQARAKPALIESGSGAASDRADLTKALLKRHSDSLRFHALALHHADARSTKARAEAFELAQWALQTDAAEALSQMSVRFAKGGGQLAGLVRERQTLIARRQAEDKRILEAIGQADPQSLKAVYASRDDTNRRLEGIDAELATKFPEYSSLASPKPLSFTETQALLNPDEALILLVEGPGFSQRMQLPEETLVWVVTKAKVSWHRVPLGTRALADHVVALRCGLDDNLWSGSASRERCKTVLKGSGYESFNESTSRQLPFDLARAHALYRALLGPAEGLIKSRHLLLVPTGALTSLPFGVLVTEPPKAATPATLADYRKAAWLGTRQPISVLPSVNSLVALRRHASASRAALPFIGFGDPALAGNGDCGAMTIPDRCPDEEIQVARGTHSVTRGLQGPATITSYFRGGLVDIAALRAACPLPDTAYELRCVARSLGAPPGSVVLGTDMTEVAVKAAPLTDYRVVHFATHGLLAGETAQLAKDKAEPALVMSPPATASEEDDGLLTASEVAGLKLDADWVILSACNTAGGKEPGAEALSGLARAFFYAGARALLVSHWYVNSEAATLLTSRTFAEMHSSARIGRAEAFRRAMLAVMKDERRPWGGHPSAWAPFVVVGEGAGWPPAPVAQPKSKARSANASSAE